MSSVSTKGLGGHDLDKKIADTLATVVSKTQRKENLFVFITCECDPKDIRYRFIHPRIETDDSNSTYVHLLA